MSDCIWIATPPADTAHTGPVIVHSEAAAEEYAQLWWEVEGPFVPVRRFQFAVRALEHLAEVDDDEARTFALKALAGLQQLAAMAAIVEQED